MTSEEICDYVRNDLDLGLPSYDILEAMKWDEFIDLVKPHAEEHPLLALLLERIAIYSPGGPQRIADGLDHLWVIRERLKMIDDGYCEILKLSESFKKEVEGITNWLDEEKAKARDSLPTELWVHGLTAFNKRDMETILYSDRNYQQ